MKRFVCIFLLLVGCNEHAVDECLPLCQGNARSQRTFDECVAFGSDECRAGNRMCCALSVGCIGELGDQTVVGPEGCLVVPMAGCLPECTDEDEDLYDACLDGEAFCEPGDESCCAMEAFCQGTLGRVAVFSVDQDCCQDDGDCLRGELCDPSRYRCLDATCDADDDCPEELVCDDGECVCELEGARCHAGEYCVDGECLEDACGGCPDGLVCDFETGACVECATSDATCDGVDDDCDGLVDESVPPASTTCGEGVCASAGVETCVDGVLVDDCVAPPPLTDVDECDGLDEDCDGVTDEDCGVCNNGVVGGPDEECDQADLDGFDCVTLGFDGGALGCLPDCTFDFEGCTCASDRDGDLDCDSHDCAPGDPQIGRFAPEACDETRRDEDCDGFIDEQPEADEWCSDGLFCTGVEQCVGGACFSGSPPCDDGNECTFDSCDEAIAMCGAPMDAPSDYPCFNSLGLSSLCDGMGMCIE